MSRTEAIDKQLLHDKTEVQVQTSPLDRTATGTDVSLVKQVEVTRSQIPSTSTPSTDTGEPKILDVDNGEKTRGNNGIEMPEAHEQGPDHSRGRIQMLILEKDSQLNDSEKSQSRTKPGNRSHQAKSVGRCSQELEFVTLQESETPGSHVQLEVINLCKAQRLALTCDGGTACFDPGGTKTCPTTTTTENTSSHIDQISSVTCNRVGDISRHDRRIREMETDSRQANGKFLVQWTHRKPNPWDTGWETLYPPAVQDAKNLENCQAPRLSCHDFVRVQVGPSQCLLVITMARLLAGKVKQKFMRTIKKKKNCPPHPHYSRQN
jgi:hypothetical protein